MAWTSKAERFRHGRTDSAEGTRPGPGAYRAHETYATERAYAPFGSTQPRGTAAKEAKLDGNNLQVGPAPGAYDPKLPSYDSGLPRKSAPFACSATRETFGARREKEREPGPGQYGVPSIISPQKMANRTMGVPQPAEKLMLKSSSAPSIPRGFQTYGYEEAGDGRLIPQGPRDGTSYLSGRTGDSAGPGHYTPATLAAGKPRSHSCSFPQAAARAQEKFNSNPGPGYYASGQQSHMENIHLGSSFASTVPRMSTRNKDEKNAGELPGPGTYVGGHPGLLKAGTRDARMELQFFGSTTDRFKEIDPEHQPGPGAYYQPHVKPRRLEGPVNKAFGEAMRFQDEADAGAAPGPGSYYAEGAHHALYAPGTFSLLGNSGGLAFGAMSKRFASLRRDADDGPGPAAYQQLFGEAAPQEPEGGLQKPRKTHKRPAPPPSSVFKSSTPKDDLTQRKAKVAHMVPPPGAYNPIPPTEVAAVVRLRSKSEGFLSAEPRFGGPREKAKILAPGPGKYQPKEPTAGQKVGSFNRSILEGMPQGGRPKGLGFQCQDKRFKDPPPVAVGPGPGAYDTERPWITKSFNCHFGDLV